MADIIKPMMSVQEQALMKAILKKNPIVKKTREARTERAMKLFGVPLAVLRNALVGKDLKIEHALAIRAKLSA